MTTCKKHIAHTQWPAIVTNYETNTATHTLRLNMAHCHHARLSLEAHIYIYSHALVWWPKNWLARASVSATGPFSFVFFVRSSAERNKTRVYSILQCLAAGSKHLRLYYECKRAPCFAFICCMFWVHFEHRQRHRWLDARHKAYHSLRIHAVFSPCNELLVHLIL